MWTIGKFVLLCTLFAPRIRGQVSGTLEEPNAYMTAVVDALWEKIKDHGISNLPVIDTSLPYNFTAFGVELIGLVSFEDGFVQDIDLVHLSTAHFESGAPLAYAYVTGHIAFDNLRIYRDFRADLTTGMKVGTIVFTPTSFAYVLKIEKLHGNDTVVPSLSFFSYTNLLWDIDPDDIETSLMRRQVQNQSLFAPTRPEFVSTTAEAWIPLFTDFLNEIIMKIDFPAVIF